MDLHWTTELSEFLGLGRSKLACEVTGPSAATYDIPPFTFDLFLRSEEIESWRAVSRFDFVGLLTYELVIKMTIGLFEFKIADDNWEFERSNPDQILAVNQPIMLEFSGFGSAHNSKVEIRENQTYRFVLKFDERYSATMRIVKHDDNE